MTDLPRNNRSTRLRKLASGGEGRLYEIYGMFFRSVYLLSDGGKEGGWGENVQFSWRVVHFSEKFTYLRGFAGGKIAHDILLPLWAVFLSIIHLETKIGTDFSFIGHFLKIEFL